MNDAEFAAWNGTKRTQVISYLETQGITCPQVGAWPAFEMAPHFGIWCVESKEQQGRIGWWVVAGDCPTDYISERGECHPRAALRELISRWTDHITYMKKGTQPPDVTFGDDSKIQELGDLLQRRVAILQDWLDDDDLWEDHNA